jgi:ketosteroid isomerase-like protein
VKTALLSNTGVWRKLPMRSTCGIICSGLLSLASFASCTPEQTGARSPHPIRAPHDSESAPIIRPPVSNAAPAHPVEPVVVVEPAPVPAAKPVTHAPAPPKPDLQAERAALIARDIAFSDASEKKGSAEAFYEFLAPDATLLQNGEPSIRGLEAIRVRMAAGTQGILTWKPVEAEISKAADMGCTWGTYEFRGKSAERKVSYGKYLSVWKKQEDGSWKVLVSSANAGPDPAPRRTETKP